MNFENFLIELYDRIENAETISDIETVFNDLRSGLGFEYGLFTVVFPITFSKSQNISVGNYPSEWVEEYMESGYAKFDPVVEHCFSKHTPIVWDENTGKGNNVIEDFFRKAHDVGLRHGMSIGHKGYDGTFCLISLARKKPIDTSTKAYKKTVVALSSAIASLQCKIVAASGAKLIEDKIVDLTPREKQCLVWAADGKTSGEIAQILGVSESTVVFHIKNFIKKLDVTNRSQAVAKAVRMGLILTDYTNFPQYYFKDVDELET